MLYVGKSRFVIIVAVSVLVEAVITRGRSDGLPVLVALVVTRREPGTIVIVARPPRRLYDEVAVYSTTRVAI